MLIEATIKKTTVASGLLVLTFLIVGCSAQKPAVSDDNEAVGIILGGYSHYKSGSKIDTADERGELEEKLERCLVKDARNSTTPIRIISAKVIKENLEHHFDLTQFDETTIDTVIEALQTKNASEVLKKTGLRYLVIVDIETNEHHPTTKPYFEAAGDSGGGIALLGTTQESTKFTSASLHLIDINLGYETEYISLSSSGDDGWTAGVFVLLILPIPYYIPWWTATESKVCDEIGDKIVGLINHADFTLDTIEMASDPVNLSSRYKNGDIVLVEFKNGDSRELTITHINDKFIVGHYKFENSRAIPSSFDLRSVKSIKKIR